jgi:hypothetical protein
LLVSEVKGNLLSYREAPNHLWRRARPIGVDGSADGFDGMGV